MLLVVMMIIPILVGFIGGVLSSPSRLVMIKRIDLLAARRFTTRKPSHPCST